VLNSNLANLWQILFQTIYSSTIKTTAETVFPVANAG